MSVELFFLGAGWELEDNFDNCNGKPSKHCRNQTLGPRVCTFHSPEAYVEKGIRYLSSSMRKRFLEYGLFVP